MFGSGRILRGSQIHTAILSEVSAAEAKRRLAAGEGDREVAKELGVSQAAISLLRRNRSWRHVPWPEGTPASLHATRAQGRFGPRS